MTRKNDEQDKLPANELASASSSNSASNATALQDPNLPAPIVPLAPDGVLLEPNRADPDGLLVEVTYPSMSVDDTIALIFNGEDTLVPQKGNVELKVTFLVPKEYVAKTVGKTVQVSYSVAGNTGAVRSQTLDLDVRLIPVGQLTAPQIVQAVGGVLDVGGLQTAADIFINAWPLIALKQKTWMQLQGFGNLNLPVWQGYEIGSTGAQVATVQRKDLQNLTDGSQLNLVLEVLFDDGLPLQPFPIRTYQIKTAPEYALGALELVGATGDVIELGVVSGDPVTVHTHAYIGQTAGDRLLLSWAGVAANGTPITYSHEYTVLAGGETGEVRFEVPRANLESLGGGTLQLSYQIIKVGGGIQNSPITTYSVTVATLNLPPLAVLGDTPEGLAPMRVINGATVQIIYPNPLPSDVIALLWNGKNDAVDWQNGAATITFIVPPSEIGLVVGKTIDVQYAVRRGTTWSTSPALRLNVLPLMEGDFKMPKVTQATDGTLGVLDLSTFTGDAEIIIEPWPFIKEGQRVWLDMTGGTAPLPILDKHQVAPGEDTSGISSSISRASLELFSDIATIEFPAKVQLDGSDSLNGANDFPLLKLQLIPKGKGSGSGSENFDESPIGEFATIFETADLKFKGGADSLVPLHHNIITRAGSTAISLQTSNDPAEIIFKTGSKPSYVSMDISVIAGNSNCIVTCLSSEEPRPMTLSPRPSQKITLYGTDITNITFKRTSFNGTNDWFLTVILDNIKWGKIDKASDLFKSATD
ncbi:hypothetical protein IFT47_16090 [Pseudomonas sp. CFBP 13711]|uniref:hypothetical protein n=1 Tax=unclassified Pseudomonas TaxID=196821 RepID=UPI00177E2F2D|nr:MULTISPECIES: hypothetical protein [unclassified Pseudomonas]MBD8708156.1 hypothetical protein [Pseudomonas sp. CFBP 13711]MBD8713604.1 hypothetical protein [Pseudomonas sp. CFBP 13715]